MSLHIEAGQLGTGWSSVDQRRRAPPTEDTSFQGRRVSPLKCVCDMLKMSACAAYLIVATAVVAVAVVAFTYFMLVYSSYWITTMGYRRCYGTLSSSICGCRSGMCGY